VKLGELKRTTEGEMRISEGCFLLALDYIHTANMEIKKFIARPK
jgi:hypothetical protein